MRQSPFSLAFNMTSQGNLQTGPVKSISNVISSGGYCESEYVVPRGCHGDGVSVLRLERERASIYDDVDCRYLVRIDNRSRPACPRVLAVIVSDTVGVDPNAHRPVVP
jgi:hypothetical protein